MSKGKHVWEWERDYGHNIIGGGHFEYVTLYRDGKKYDQWVYDGTLLYKLSIRRAKKKVRELVEMYGATPR